VIWYKNFEMVMSIEALQSFDPFTILDVPSDATLKEIKKQYRKLSLEKHPDKNPDNPLAVQEFIRLTKAYNVLTDETAYENFKKYGNPDGPGSYSVAIALPKYLLQPDNQIFVLSVAFFILLVLIPGLLYVNFGDTTYKDEQGVLLENKRHYGAKLNENLIPKNLPLILSQAIEYQEMGARDQTELDKLKKLRDNDAIADLLPQTVSRKTKNQNLKPTLLIAGYLCNDERFNDPALKEGLQTILKSGVNHVQMMMQVGQEINQMSRQGASVKKLGAKAFTSIINFQQMFIQGLWEKSDPLLQLPEMTIEEVKRYRRLLKQH
jgi:translocation protein SEC63